MDARSGLPRWTSREIVAARPPADRPSPGDRPLDVLRELEPAGGGRRAEVCTIFLRGSECRFRCAMCDLWKSTHWEPTRPGAVPAQIQWAIERAGRTAAGTRPSGDGGEPSAGRGQPEDRARTLPGADRPERWIKLYNAANFFADVNVPRRDLPQIARLVRRFDRVVVENHPKLLGRHVLEFRDGIDGQLEIAMGLETAHPPTLAWLNKSLTVEGFSAACRWLVDRGIDLRAFVLLGLPGMPLGRSIHWCRRSIDLARDCGVRHISIIPMRTGGGVIDRLERRGMFAAPTAAAVESILEGALGGGSIVTVDLWDFDRLSGLCAACRGPRRHRLEQINLDQTPLPLIVCPVCQADSTSAGGHSTGKGHGR